MQDYLKYYFDQKTRFSLDFVRVRIKVFVFPLGKNANEA